MPVNLMSEDPPWKLKVLYEPRFSRFSLSINDMPFSELPYQANLMPYGPQNIDKGSIWINGTMLNDPSKNCGFTPYSETMVAKLCEEMGVPFGATTKQVKLDEGFKCSSSEVINGLLDDLCKSIDEEQGLVSFELEKFYEKNLLECWVLNQIVVKSPSL